MSNEVSMKNTKKEMLDLIETLNYEIKNKEKENLNPEKIKQEAKQKSIIEDSDKIVDAALTTHIHQLKVLINKELTTLSDKLEAEAGKYENLKNAIEIKEAELNEIYGVEKATAELAVILEAQKSTREDFECEMHDKKEQLENELIEKKIRLENEIRETKEQWEKEKLLQKGFEGEINVLTAKISAFETLVKEQTKQIEKLNLQQEKAYEKVQDIPNKAVSGAAERLQNITVRTMPDKQN